MIEKRLVLPLAVAAAVSLAGPVLACGENASCTECKADERRARATAVPAKASTKAQARRHHHLHGGRHEVRELRQARRFEGVRRRGRAQRAHRPAAQDPDGHPRQGAGRHGQAPGRRSARTTSSPPRRPAPRPRCTPARRAPRARRAAPSTPAPPRRPLSTAPATAECKSECQEHHAPAKPAHK